MSTFRVVLGRIYAGMLWVYPPRFRAQFGLEMQAVFSQMNSQAAKADGWALLVLILRELKDLPLAALRQHLREMKELHSILAIGMRDY